MIFVSTNAYGLTETLGKIYKIAETDALKELENIAENVNFKEKIKKEKEDALKNYQPADLTNLPTANVNKTFLVDMTYTSEFEIKDSDGRIIYPKGYTINPLDYVTYNDTIVIINPTDERQLKWFEESAYKDKLNVRLLITDGSFYKVNKKLKTNVYYLTNIISDRLNLNNTPSVVIQKGKYMEVTEYAME